MSIVSAFNNAGSGLAASSRLAETISNNVANAMTEGYARRTTELSSLSSGGFGGGVRITGTTRAENAQLTGERRLMAAAAGSAVTLGEARDRVLASLGEPGDAGSLASRATAFETSLISAAATPSSSIKLDQAVEAARRLIDALRGGAEEAAQLRTDAEGEIVRQVGMVNQALHEVASLNQKIRAGTQQGLDVASLEDQRTRAIDGISGILPVRTVKREGGDVSLYTSAGGALLDGRVWELKFERSAPVITPETSGVLNGLFQDRGNGPEAVTTRGSSALFGGGSLAALFEVRDEVAPEMLRELDRYAEDLAGRFGEDLLDRIQPPASPDAYLDGEGRGLFVDSGGGEVGLSSRLALNPSVDPEQGGNSWRLRDGLGSEEVAPAGFGDYLQAMVDMMNEPRSLGGMRSTSASLGSASLAGEIGSYFGAEAARAEEKRAFLSGQSAALAEQETGALGVDTDAQLQFLMLVEQSFAANARVLTVLDSLMKQLLEI